MQVLNPEAASNYLDSVRDDRQRSAVLAVHLAWLDHSTPFGRGERLEPQAPLDLLILYQAAAGTFRDWPEVTAPPQHESLAGRVINQPQADEQLHSLSGRKRQLANLFTRHVRALSTTAGQEQDLDYYLKLFLTCLADERVIDNIANGALSTHSAALSDPDLW